MEDAGSSPVTSTMKNQYGVFEDERAIGVASTFFDRTLRGLAKSNRSIGTLSHERVLAVGELVVRFVAAMPVPIKFDGQIREFVVGLYDRLKSDHESGLPYRRYRVPQKRRKVAAKVVAKLESLIGENQ